MAKVHIEASILCIVSRSICNYAQLRVGGMAGWRRRGAFFWSGALGCEMEARARTLKGFERIVTHTFACVCAVCGARGYGASSARRAVQCTAIQISM